MTQKKLFKHSLVAYCRDYNKARSFYGSVVALGYKNCTNNNPIKHESDIPKNQEFYIFGIGPELNGTPSVRQVEEFVFFYGRELGTGSVFRREFDFNIDNVIQFNQALGIAAIVNDDCPHVGEWIYDGDNHSDIFPKKMDIINNVHILNDKSSKFDCYERFNARGRHNWAAVLGQVRKATPSEILHHIVQHYSDKLIIISKTISTMEIPKKEIVGYKLIKEYPGCPSEDHRELVYESLPHLWFTREYGKGGISVENPEKYPDFWEPVYEEEIKEIKMIIECDEDFDITITKGEYINAPERNIRIGQLQELKTTLSKSFNDWSFSINSVNIGCKKNIPVRYLDEIIDNWNKINS